MCKNFLHGLISQLIVSLVELRMLGLGHPIRNAFLKLFDAHPRMGHRYDLQETFVTLSGEQGWDIPLENRLDHRLLGKLWIVCSTLVDDVEGISHLEWDWVFGPKGSIVIKYGDPLGLGDKVRGLRIADPLDIGDQSPLGRAVLPGAQCLGSIDGRAIELSPGRLDPKASHSEAERIEKQFSMEWNGHESRTSMSEGN